MRFLNPPFPHRPWHLAGHMVSRAFTLLPLAVGGLWWLALSPATTAWQSYWQGALVHSRSTRGVTESVVVLLAVTAAVLAAGVAWQGAPGVYFAAAGMLLGGAAQAVWLGIRARDTLRAVVARDSER